MDRRDKHVTPNKRKLRIDTTNGFIAKAAQDGARAEAILPALGMAQVARSQPAATLSGGQKTRLALASVLVSGPQVLLLDEPTNHLDLAMLAWLEEWLVKQQGTVVMVSHDRTFLDHTANGILELDELKHTLRYYDGN